MAIPPRAAFGMPRGRVSGGAASGRGRDGPERSGDHSRHRDATAGERVPRRVARDDRRRPARGVQPRGERGRDPPRRAREEDSDRTPRKSGSEAEESSVSHDAVDGAETDGNVDEAGTEPGDTDEAEESFASDDDPDAGEKLFDPSSESDSDGFLAGHDPSYDTLPTSFSMAEEALRDCLLVMLAEGPLPMAALMADGQMTNQMSRFMPRRIPLEGWIERRIGAEVETVMDGEHFICQLLPAEEHVGAPRRDVREEPPNMFFRKEPPGAEAKAGQASQNVPAPKAKARVCKASDEVPNVLAPKAEAKAGKASEAAPKAKAKVEKLKDPPGLAPKAKAKVDVGEAPKPVPSLPLKPVPKARAKASKVSVPEGTEPQTLSGLRSRRDRSRTPRGETKTRRRRELRYPESVVGVVSRPPPPRTPTPEFEDPPGEWREPPDEADRWPVYPPFDWEKRNPLQRRPWRQERPCRWCERNECWTHQGHQRPRWRKPHAEKRQHEGEEEERCEVKKPRPSKASMDVEGDAPGDDEEDSRDSGWGDWKGGEFEKDEEYSDYDKGGFFAEEKHYEFRGHDAEREAKKARRRKKDNRQPLEPPQVRGDRQPLDVPQVRGDPRGRPSQRQSTRRVSRPPATSSGKDRAESARGSRDPRPDRAESARGSRDSRPARVPRDTAARRKSGIADPKRSGRDWWKGSGLDGRQEQKAHRAAQAAANPQFPAILKHVRSWLAEDGADLGVLKTNLTQHFDAENKEEHGKKPKHGKRYRRRARDRAADRAAEVETEVVPELDAEVSPQEHVEETESMAEELHPEAEAVDAADDADAMEVNEFGWPVRVVHRNFRCSNAGCGFQIHSEQQYGTFCCKKCHKVERFSLKRMQHGSKCGKKPASETLTQATFRVDPRNPLDF